MPPFTAWDAMYIVTVRLKGAQTSECLHLQQNNTLKSTDILVCTRD